MQIGIHAPHLGRELDPGTVRSFVKECDVLGVHSLWVSDHVCWPADVASKYPYTDDGSFPATPDMGWLDPIGTLLFIAGCTDRVRLGTTVLILPYRPPVATAKQLATLNMPSRDDVLRISEDLRNIDRRLSQLERTLGRLVDQGSGTAAGKKSPARTRKPPAKKAEE